MGSLPGMITRIGAYGKSIADKMPVCKAIDQAQQRFVSLMGRIAPRPKPDACLRECY